MIPEITHLLDLAGVLVFALSGVLVASRKQMDVIGFALLATFTGLGGGTLRDVILDRPVIWLQDASYLTVCAAAAVVGFFVAQHIQTRYRLLLWLDAIGLGAFAVLGAKIALESGAPVPAAVVLGVMTATFGGLVRDVVSGEEPLILKQEIYATAALLGAGVYALLLIMGLNDLPAAVAGMGAGFVLRGLAIIYRLTLPRYRSRAGRKW